MYEPLKIQAAKAQKGLNGERKLDYHLRMLPSTIYSVLNDISFELRDITFQIDACIVSNHAIYLIDSKSIDGEAIFSTQLEQLTQKYKNKERNIKYPLTQLESNKFLIMQWLQERSLEGFPIYYFVSIADSTTIIKVIGDESHIATHVTFAENIPFYIKRQNETLEKRYPNGNPTLKNKIVTQMMQAYKDLKIDYFKKFKIDISDVQPGVICKKCYRLETTYLKGKWICQHCHYIDRFAYRRSLEEFFILFGPSISNKEARWFLRVPSRVTITKILQRSNLIYNRQNKRWYKQK